MRDDSGLASCAVHCRHCGIRFLTHRRNANRRNLHCPFGCREHHRRQQANERSRKYYRTEQGRRKKKLLNGKRSAVVSDTDTLPETAQPETEAGDEDVSLIEASGAEATAQASLDPDVSLTLEEFTLDEATLVNSPLLPYLAMVAGLIEGRVIHCEELLQALLRSMRQRSFDRLPWREYVLRFLDQHPP